MRNLYYPESFIRDSNDIKIINSVKHLFQNNPSYNFDEIYFGLGSLNSNIENIFIKGEQPTNSEDIVDHLLRFANNIEPNIVWNYIE